ncbi:hypothetical protein L2E82_42147 [Cichorium intybus]|uniref:Uncharacterized protein n=1 Tax=Cichorium intybus TaxID=13427 RepID=A0ACB8ZQX9_CICIN|nr:hypothetical protein L2E82_42147 [Cichorium intybus]
MDTSSLTLKAAIDSVLTENKLSVAQVRVALSHYDYHEKVALSRVMSLYESSPKREEDGACLFEFELTKSNVEPELTKSKVERWPESTPGKKMEPDCSIEREYREESE